LLFYYLLWPKGQVFVDGTMYTSDSASGPRDGSRMCSLHITVLCCNNDLAAVEMCEVCLASYHRYQCIWATLCQE